MCSAPAGQADLANRPGEGRAGFQGLAERQLGRDFTMASSVAAGAARSASIASASAWISSRWTWLSWKSPRQSCSDLRSPTTLPVRDRVVQGREELQQVAQLPWCVCAGRAGIPGSSWVIAAPGRRSAGTRGRSWRGPGPPRSGAPSPGAAGIADLQQRLAPVVGDGTEPRSAQRRGQPPPNSRARRLTRKSAERLEIGWGRGDQLPGAVEQEPSRSTSRSLVGVVRSPSHLDSVL